MVVAYYHCSDIVSFSFHVHDVLSDLLATRLLLVNLSSDQIIVFELKLLLVLSRWLILEGPLITVAGSNGGGDHPIPAVVGRYCCYWCGRHCLAFLGVFLLLV